MTRKTSTYRRLLSEHGIRPTTPRVRIAEAFLDKPQHCSADELHKRLKREKRGVSLATVYNTLNLMADSGLVREVRIAPDHVVFDSNTTPHHHFFNESTGQMHDIPAKNLRVEGIPRVPRGTEQSGIDVVVRVRRKKR